MYRIIGILFLVMFGQSAFSGLKDGNSDPQILISQLISEIQEVSSAYILKVDLKRNELERLNRMLYSAESPGQKIELLFQKDRILHEIEILNSDVVNEISKIRYLKGLQIIKILYEKVLSLDHHFTSVRTFTEINKISNPNQYPEYNKLKEIISTKKDKRSGFDLTSVLGTNTIVSVVQTFTNMMGSNLTKEEKEKELANVECILDFTLRMQNDLNLIYFETAFLHTSNDKIKQDIELLFKDYSKPIGYSDTLEKCRANDDWETITQKMTDYLAKMKNATGAAQYKMQVNLEFPIDRLLQFIIQYNNFIDQGGKFYEKFKIILSSYENEKQCETKLPPEYKKLKSDIDIAIDKFNVAYKPIEINGTKMKEILYGLNEFD